MGLTTRAISLERLAAAPWYKWAVVGMLAVAAFLNEVDRHAVFALFPLLEKELGMSNLQLSLLGSAFLWAYALLGPQAGYIGDRYPRRIIIIGSLFAWSIVTGLNAFARTGQHLIILRVLLAVSEAFYMPAALAFLTEHHPDKTRAKAVAVHISSMAIGQIAGGFFGGYMGEYFNWRLLFLLCGAAGILYVPILMLILHPPPRAAVAGPPKERMSFLRAGRTLASVATMRYLALAFVCYTVVGNIMQTWLPYFLFNRFHTSLTAAGFSAPLFLQLPTAFGNLAWGAAGDYFATRHFRGRMLTQAGSLMISAPFLLGLGLAGSLPGVALSLALLGFLRAGWPTNWMAVVCRILPSNLRATSCGFLNFLGNVSAGLALLVAGPLGKRFGFGSAFATLSSLHWLAAGVLIFAAFRRLKHDLIAETVPTAEPAPTKR